MTHHLAGFTVALDPAASALHLSHGPRFIRALQPALSCRVAGETRRLPLLAGAAWISSGDQDLRIQGQAGPFAVELVIRPAAPYLSLQWRVKLTEERADVRLLSIQPFATRITDTWLGQSGAASLRLWHTPYDVWGTPRTAPLNETRAGNLASASHWLGGIYHPDSDEALFLGHRLPAQWIDAIQADEETLRVTQTIDLPLAPRCPLYSDPLYLGLDLPIVTALGRFPTAQAPRRQPEEGRAHWGWNSWDYYKLDVTPEAVLENVAAIRSTPWLRDRIRYIIIDDGWETYVGDWEPNAKFSRGMRDLAARIRAAGFIPGIWSAPFFCDTHARILREHPEWAVQCQGRPFSPYRLIGCDPPWGDRCYLDPTRPEVRDHVYATYRKLREWGFGYFKTDFLANPLKPRFDPLDKQHALDLQYHDPDQGLHRAHRSCMQAIRAAIGEDSFWLGCGSIFATGAGLMDASRISSDIGIYTCELRNCAASAALNFHFHGPLWLNDPDFAVFRGRDTAHLDLLDDKPDGAKPYDPNVGRTGPTFSADQARMWASLLMLSGGLLTLGDRIRALNPLGLSILQTTLDYAGGPPAIPLDPHRAPPTLLYQQGPARRLLGLFNWGDADPLMPDAVALARLALPATLHELWTDQSLPAAALPALVLPPQTCRLFAWSAS